jgi:hypothetical protein
MAKSYIHYAPKLGYQASVFNLVFVDNFASIKLVSCFQSLPKRKVLTTSSGLTGYGKSSDSRKLVSSLVQGVCGGETVWGNIMLMHGCFTEVS